MRVDGGASPRSRRREGECAVTAQAGIDVADTAVIG